jgi:hypothetical protein
MATLDMLYLIKKKDYMKVLVEKIFELRGRSSYFHTDDGRLQCYGCELIWPKNVFPDEDGNPTDNKESMHWPYAYKTGPHAEKWAFLNKWSYKRKFSESTKMSAIMESYGGIELGGSPVARDRITNKNDATQLSYWLMRKAGNNATFSLRKFWGSMSDFYLLTREKDRIDINYCTKTDEFGGAPVGGKTGYGTR